MQTSLTTGFVSRRLPANKTTQMTVAFREKPSQKPIRTRPLHQQKLCPRPGVLGRPRRELVRPNDPDKFLLRKTRGNSSGCRVADHPRSPFPVGGLRPVPLPAPPEEEVTLGSFLLPEDGPPARNDVAVTAKFRLDSVPTVSYTIPCSIARSADVGPCRGDSGLRI